MWTMNFQMFKLVLKKAEDPEIKLPTSVGSSKKQESSRKNVYFCFIDDPADVGSLISDFSAFSKSSLNIWKFTVHVLLRPGLENFEHYFASVWDECNCAVVWAFFGIAFFWDWDENRPFSRKAKAQVLKRETCAFKGRSLYWRIFIHQCLPSQTHILQQ